MTTKCSSNCYPICDFCSHHTSERGGYFQLHEVKMAPEDVCEDFYCMTLKGVEVEGE